MNMNYTGLNTLHQEPKVLAVDNFLTDEEIASLIQLATPELKSSGIMSDAADDACEEANDYRTSSSAHIFKSKTEWLLQKVHNLTNKPIADMERPQVGHYKPGQLYKEHV